MRVRIVYFCPRCGSVLFRPSISRLFRDSLLSKLGIHPQRCYMCRLRFYLLKPLRAKTLVAALDRTWLTQPSEHPSPIPVEASTNSMAASVGEAVRR